MKKPKTYSFKMLAKDTLEKTNMPLTVEEMWEQAKICGFDKRINTSGKRHGEHLVHSCMSK